MKHLTALIFFVFAIYCVSAQDETLSIQEQIGKQRFEFIAESAAPLRGRTIYLSPTYYNIKVSSDSVISNLPYYGRSYQASLNPSDVGLSFSSTDFEYTKKDRKKGGWDITIKCKDVKYAPQIFITISTNGSASVRINATDRQSISYNGRLKKS